MLIAAGALSAEGAVDKVRLDARRTAPSAMAAAVVSPAHSAPLLCVSTPPPSPASCQVELQTIGREAQRTLAIALADDISRRRTRFAEASPQPPPPPPPAAVTPSTMSAKEIKAELTARGVSYAGCIERAELVALLEACLDWRGDEAGGSRSPPSHSSGASCNRASERASEQQCASLSNDFGGLSVMPERFVGDESPPETLLSAGAAKWVNRAFGV